MRRAEPARPFSIAHACLDAQPAGNLALLEDDGARTRAVTFGQLRALSQSAAAHLLSAGAQPGDRVAILLPQGIAFAAALFGALSSRLVAVPISTQFGLDGLVYRLADAETSVVVTDTEGLDKVDAIQARLPRSPALVLADAGWPSPSTASTGATPSGDPESNPEAPALLMYTSGSTGNPKGVLHAHRALRGQRPGLQLALEGTTRGGIFWTPADWPWIALALLGMWLQGRPVLAAARRGFDAGWAWSLLERHEVALTFLTPTAMRLLAEAKPKAGLRVETVISGGEPVGEDLHEWTRATMGAPLVSIYGQTEADILVGDAPTQRRPTPGAMGHAYPGHRLAVVDPAGREVAPGVPGELVLRLPDDALMLGYWRQPDATGRKVREGSMWTGDEVEADADGLLWFRHRTDDLIKSGGYRIGPGEIEDCLLSHPKVANAAVIGAADAVRGQVVKAFVVLSPGNRASAGIERELRDHVGRHLAAFLRPRLFEFVVELPLTVTGKVDRSQLRARDREHRQAPPRPSPA